jgi:hypothetical protein
MKYLHCSILLYVVDIITLLITKRSTYSEQEKVASYVGTVNILLTVNTTYDYSSTEYVYHALLMFSIIVMTDVICCKENDMME